MKLYSPSHGASRRVIPPYGTRSRGHPGSSQYTKQVETGEASGSSYEQEASDDMEPPEVRKTRHELARDPDYNPESDEIN